MDRVSMLENILNRGTSRLSVKELIPGPAITYDYVDDTPLEERISTFLDMLEHEEKNEKWPSGISTYQISKIKQYSLDFKDYSMISATSDALILRKYSFACTICLNFIRKNEIVKELPCKHIFHRTCVEQWLKIKAICPIDRSSLLDLI